MLGDGDANDIPGTMKTFFFFFFKEEFRYQGDLPKLEAYFIASRNIMIFNKVFVGWYNGKGKPYNGPKEDG